MRLAVLGFGLIGGSVVRALRRPGPPAPDAAWSRDLEIAAWSPSGEGPRRALGAGLVQVAAPSPETAIEGAGVVLLAGPPTSVLEWLDRLVAIRGADPHSGPVVTDVASTKGAIVARADALGLRFVGGHPMAGRETSGFGASDPELLVDRPWVVVPGRAADEEAVALVEGLARAAGALPVRMTAEAHDRVVAAISHLPLLASVALVESVLGAPGSASADDVGMLRRLAASGWRDATRLARGNPAMGAGILVTNRAAVAERLRRFRAVVDEWLAILEADTVDALSVAERLARARARIESGTDDGPAR